MSKSPWAIVRHVAQPGRSCDVVIDRSLHFAPQTLGGGVSNYRIILAAKEEGAKSRLNIRTSGIMGGGGDRVFVDIVNRV